MNWKNKFEQELILAATARERGNEGQARVCARRAAGVVAREYFERQGRSMHSPSAIDLLNDLLKVDGLSEQARNAAENLTLRVTEEFKLPEGIDLLRDVRVLAANLLSES